MKRRDFFIKSCEPAGHKPTGFTLVELAVVLGILGLLAALLVPAVQQARSASRRVACMNHLRQLGLAMHNIVDATGGFPTSNNPQPGYWRMLPYLDQGALYERLVRYDIPEAFNVDVFNCPEDGWLSGEVGEANYFLNSGTVLSRPQPFLQRIPCGRRGRTGRLETQRSDGWTFADCGDQ